MICSHCIEQCTYFFLCTFQDPSLRLLPPAQPCSQQLENYIPMFNRNINFSSLVINRDHCQQLSLELFFIKDRVQTNVDSVFCALNTLVFIRFFHAGRTTNKIIDLHCIGWKTNISVIDKYLKTSTNKTKISTQFKMCEKIRFWSFQ